jgi:hypothetical protein
MGEHPTHGSLARLAVELSEQDVTSTGEPLQVASKNSV